MTTLNFDSYASNKARMAVLESQISRLEDFAELTGQQEARLQALQLKARTLKLEIDSHERACLVERISFDGSERLHAVGGHTPAGDLNNA